MAVNVGTVEVLLELRDLLKQQAAQTTAVLSRLEKAATQTTTATDRLGKSHDRSASSIDKFGRQIKTTLVHVFAAGAAYKLLGAAVDSIGKSVEFVRTFEKIENITGVARTEVERLRGSINELSTATGKGPQELAEGFYFIASAGLKGAEATEVLTQAARSSAVGLGDTAVIARSITSALNAYGKENLSAADAANQLFVTVREGGAEASEVAVVFGRIVGIANEMGVSFAEVGASIATFTRLGVGADEAVTALRGTLSTLLKPDKQTREAINELAFAFGRTTMSARELREEIKQRGLADVLITLNKAAGGNVEILGRLVPNIRALAGVLGNTGQQAEAYREILQQMTTDSAALNTAFDDVSQSASFKWDQVKAQFEQLSITIGTHLLPGVIEFGKALNEIDPETIKRLGTNLATLIGLFAQATQAAVNMFDAMSNGFSALREKTESLNLDFTKLIREGTSFLNNFLTYSQRAEAAIADMASAARRAGEAQATLFDVKKGGTVTFTEYEKLKKDVVAASESITELARVRDSLAVGDKRADGGRIVDVDQLKAARAEMQQQIDVEVRRRDALKETIQVASENNRITRDASVGFRLLAETAGKVKFPDPPTDATKAFAHRIGEVTERLKDQLDVAKAAFDLAKARASVKLGLGGELSDEEAISQEKRIQLQIDRTIHSLQTNKNQLTREQLAEIKRIVTETIKWQDAARDLEGLMKALGGVLKQNDEFTRRLRESIAEANRIGLADMADKVRASYGFQNTLLQKQLDLSRDILSAWVEGGSVAAHATAIYQDAVREGGQMTMEQARALALVAEEQGKLNYLIERMGELAKPAWQIYYDAAFSVIDSIGNALSDAIVEAGMTGKVEWENIWESLKQTLLQIFADMLAEMLKRWITNQLLMKAASQSINGSSGFGDPSSPNYGTGALLQAGGETSAAGGAGVSTSTMLGAGLIAYGLFVVYKGFIEDHKRKFAGITLGDQGQIISSAQHGKKYMDGLLDTVETLVTSLKGWLKEFDIQMKSFASITLESDKSGFSVMSGTASIGHFKTAEEAISAAQAFMIKFGEFADSVPELVRAAIRASDVNMESITSNVAFARQLLTQNMEDIGLAIHDSTELFLEQMRRSFELFGQVGRNFNPQALMEATGSAILYFTNSLQELYNQLTGHKEDPRETAERQRQAYNLQRAIMIAQITLLLEEVRARVAVVQSQIAMLNALRNTPGFEGGGGPGGGVGDPTSEGPGNAPGSGSGVGRGKGGGMLVQDERNPTNNPQLAALLQVLDNLARAIAGLPPEIGEGGVKPGRRGGGGGGGGRAQGVRDFIEDQRFQLAQAGRSPLQQEIESIRRSFAEQLEAAGKNVKLRQELLALEQQSIEAARKRFQEDVENRFKEITGQTNSFTELRKRFADMRRDINEAGFAASRAATMLAELAEAEKAAVEVLSQQMAGDLLGGLAQYIEDEKVRAEFLKQAAFIKFNLDMANYKAQFKILQVLGTLAPEVLDGIQKAFDWIEAHPPTFPGTSGDSTGGDTATPPPFAGTFVGERTVWDGWVWTWNGTNWIQGNQHIPPQGGSGTGSSGPTTGDSIRRAQELLQRYRDEGMNRWQRALTELNRDFEEIRRWLGDTPEIALAYADALHRLREEFLEGLRDYYNELRNFGASQSVAQQFAAARTQYEQLLGAVQGGDLSQAGALQRAAAQLEQLAQQMFGTATGGYQNIRAQILADLEAILGIVSPTGNNVIGGPEWFASGNAASIAATTHVADVVSLSGASRDAWLQRIDEKLGRLVGEPAEPIDPDAAPFSYGDSSRWGGSRK